MKRLPDDFWKPTESTPDTIRRYKSQYETDAERRKRARWVGTAVLTVTGVCVALLALWGILRWWGG